MFSFLRRRCEEPGCTKSSCHTSAAKVGYCTKHARAHGLQPEPSRARSKACSEEGCSKIAQRSHDGSYKFCVRHMRAHGIAPHLDMKPNRCAKEGCSLGDGWPGT